MEQIAGKLSRRSALKYLGAAGGGLALASLTNSGRALAQGPDGAKALESFTGPGANPHWNSVGPYVTEPQKAPLILLTDRPVQLETPRHYFRTVFTPNEAFYVRWHLGEIPNVVDLGEWMLKSMFGEQPEPAAAARRWWPVGQWGNGKRDVDRRAAPRASGSGGRQERLGAGAI